MNPKQLIAHMTAVFAKCVGIAEKKNADYSGHNSNAFRNFMHVEEMGVASAEAGILVRLSDKFSRMANLLKSDPKVVDEKLEDTIEDAINYLAILHALRESRKGKGTKKAE